MWSSIKEVWGLRGTVAGVTTDARRTRAQLLAQQIERTISERALQPGDSLGTIEEWRTQTGYARATVSEAIRITAERGTVEVRPGRSGGLFVAAENPVIGLARTLIAVVEASSTFDQAISVIDAIEPLVDADAARARTDDDVADVRTAIAELESVIGDELAFQNAALALHERIAQISPNAVLKVVYIAVCAVIREGARREARPDESASALRQRHRARLELHREVAEAVISGDPARAARAAAAMPNGR